MAFVVADRVQETSTTSGTGTLSLAGATSGFQSFTTGIGSGNTTYYTIYDPTAGVWEVGIGTVTAGTPNTLSRTTILSNSSGNTSPLTLAGNSVFVWCDYPAETAVIQDLTYTANAPQLRASNGIMVNSQTVAANYTVASGDNALSAGPVTISTGITVTVSSGSVWVVA